MSGRADRTAAARMRRYRARRAFRRAALRTLRTGASMADLVSILAAIAPGVTPIAVTAQHDPGERGHD